MKFVTPQSAAPPATSAPREAPAGSGDDFVLEGRYEPGPVLGQGGMGRVVSAFDRVLGRDVALKEVLEPTPALEARFKREARLTAELDHPGIVPVYDAGRTPDGRLFYTMRLVRGLTLRALAATAPERLRLVAHVRDAARAVGYAHQRGIVHRDLKPDNVMVGPLGEVQVADWGLALRLAEAEPGVVGTTGYVAPEVLAGQPASPRADVWALGVVLRDVLPADAPDELRAVVTRATHPEPGRRYEDARALAEELSSWLDGRPVSAHTYSRLELWRRFARRFRLPLRIAVVAGLLVSVGVGTAWRRAWVERGAARAANVELLVTQARLALRGGAVPEGWVMAAKAHALQPTADTAGLLAQVRASVLPVLVEAQPLACDWVEPAPDGETWLCAQGDALALTGREGVRWRLEGAVERAAFSEHGRAVVASVRSRGLVVVDVASGTQRLVDAVPVHALRRVGVSDDGLLAYATNHSWVRLVTPAGVVDCSRAGSTNAGWQWFELDDEGLLASAADGRWWHCSASGWREVDRPRLPAADSTSMFSSMLRVAHDTWLLGTTEGLVYRERWGAPRELLAAMPGAASVERLVAGPTAELVWVLQSAGGAVLVARGSGEVVGALPEKDHGRLVQRADGTVTTFSRARRAVWRLDGAPGVTRQRFDHGLASLVMGAGGVFVSGSDGLVGHVRLDGLERRTWALGSSVIKEVSVAPDGLRAATVTAGAGPQVALIDLRAHEVQQVNALVGRHVGWRNAHRLWVTGYRDLGEVDLDDGRVTRVDAGAVDWAEATQGPTPLLLNERGEVARWTPDGLQPVVQVPDGAVLAAAAQGFFVAGEREVRRFDAEGRALGVPWPVRSGLTALAVSADGSRVALGFVDGGLEVRSVDGVLELRVQGHAERVSGLAFGPEGAVYSVSWDHSLQRVLLEGAPADDVEARLGLSLHEAAQVVPAGR